MPLTIKPKDKCEFDLLTFGEVMLRLSPKGHGRIEYADELEVWVGGAEYNVAYAAARLGLRCGFTSKLVENPMGRVIHNHGRAVGLDMSPVVWMPFDGVGLRDRNGIYFSEVGMGVRASTAVYDRGHTAIMHAKPGEIDWKALFEKRGTRWFHTCGITTALSDSAAAVVRESMEAARAAGVIVSYDLNFRSKLWSSEKAIETTKPIVPLIDVLVGNEEDFQKVLGFKVEGVDENLQKLPVEKYKAMVKRVVEAYPNLKAVGTTLREVVSGLVNNWGAILFFEGKFYESRRYENLEIEDRVGGGDGFASGFISAFLAGEDPQFAVDFGAAPGARLQSTRGDTSMGDLKEVTGVMKGGSARIKR